MPNLLFLLQQVIFSDKIVTIKYSQAVPDAYRIVREKAGTKQK